MKSIFVLLIAIFLFSKENLYSQTIINQGNKKSATKAPVITQNQELINYINDLTDKKVSLALNNQEKKYNEEIKQLKDQIAILETSLKYCCKAESTKTQWIPISKLRDVITKYDPDFPKSISNNGKITGIMSNDPDKKDINKYEKMMVRLVLFE